MIIVHLATLIKNFVRYYLLINSIYNKFGNFILFEFKISLFVILLTLVVNIYYKKGRKKEKALEIIKEISIHKILILNLSLNKQVRH